MSASYMVQSPQILHIVGAAGAFYYGGDQAWFRKYLQRLSGCGPTTAAHLLYYLARTRKSCAPLAPYEATHKQGFLRHMERVWQYVTPGMKGVNSTAMFMEGVARYSQDYNVPLSLRSLEIPPMPRQRPSHEALFQFLMASFSQDLPVAFLNLDNGRVPNLDNWHWVTLIGCDPSAGSALMYDQGKRAHIDLALWLEVTRHGGGFVVVSDV